MELQEPFPRRQVSSVVLAVIGFVSNWVRRCSPPFPADPERIKQWHLQGLQPHCEDAKKSLRQRLESFSLPVEAGLSCRLCLCQGTAAKRASGGGRGHPGGFLAPLGFSGPLGAGVPLQDSCLWPFSILMSVGSDGEKRLRVALVSVADSGRLGPR